MFLGERKVFGVNFNIESALAVHQLPIRWQIFNSRGGSFGLKLALACIMLANHFAVHKCVFIQNGWQLTTKKCYLQQIALHLAAKRKVKCSKTQCN